MSLALEPKHDPEGGTYLQKAWAKLRFQLHQDPLQSGENYFNLLLWFNQPAIKSHRAACSLRPHTHLWDGERTGEKSKTCGLR